MQIVTVRIERRNGRAREGKGKKGRKEGRKEKKKECEIAVSFERLKFKHNHCRSSDSIGAGEIGRKSAIRNVNSTLFCTLFVAPALPVHSFVNILIVRVIYGVASRINRSTLDNLEAKHSHRMFAVCRQNTLWLDSDSISLRFHVSNDNLIELQQLEPAPTCPAGRFVLLFVSFPSTNQLRPPFKRFDGHEPFFSFFFSKQNESPFIS